MGVSAVAVKDWLKARVDCPAWTVGVPDGTQAWGICVQDGPVARKAAPGVGGGTQSVETLHFRLVLRWGRDAALAAAKAAELQVLLAETVQAIGGRRACVWPVHAQPVPGPTGNDGIISYHIDIKIIAER